jgi:hypothetical protein
VKNVIGPIFLRSNLVTVTLVDGEKITGEILRHIASQAQIATAPDGSRTPAIVPGGILIKKGFADVVFLTNKDVASIT